ncbi:MAG TPA: hypothetical protein VFV52_15365 [Bacilli bacterium]|nr:hypothetical protein [Bacilli bacterium]
MTKVRVVTDNTRQQAQDLAYGVRYRATLATPGDEDWYRLELAAGEAVEFDLFDLPPKTDYAVELYDGDGNLLTSGRRLGERVRIGAHAAIVSGAYYLCVYSLDGSDPRHAYALHIDRYQALEGVIAEEMTLTPEQGPYHLGKSGVTLLSGATLRVEAGTVLNVRSGGQVHVQEGARLAVQGEARHPVFVLGVAGDKPPRSWLTGAGVGAGTAETLLLQGVLEQQDLLPKESVLQQGAEEVIVREGLYEPQDPTQIPPSERAAWIRDWYLAASPYRFTWFEGLEWTGNWSDPLKVKRQEVYFGLDVELFTDWEVESGRLTDERFAAGELNYWEFVNAGFLADLEEARQVAQGSKRASHVRVQHFADYLTLGRQWLHRHGVWKVSHLLSLFHKPEESEWLAHLRQLSDLFWLSHNTGVVYWDDLARQNGLHAGEDVFEALFINGVIIRVDYTASLQFALPVFGHKLPPIGLIGLMLHHGPFRYPDVYPAPKPEGDAQEVEVDTAAQLVQAYLRFTLEARTNPVFTWWIPTGADDELRRLMKEKGLTFESSLDDWKRELVQPAWKTLLEIRQKYLGQATHISV